MDRRVLTIAFAIAMAAPLLAQSRPKRAPKPAAAPRPTLVVPAPPSDDSLAAITRRGRAIAVADSVSWLASGAMTALSLPLDGIRRLIARHTEHGWEVAYGTLSSDESTYLITRLATPGIQIDWASSLFEPPRADTGYFARAARAIEASLTMFRPVEHRPHIATVIPADDGPWWLVYVYPAPIEAGVWPRGGDMRFRVSADGRIVTEARRLHETIAEYSVRTARSATTKPGDGQPPVSGNAPEDTDVFHIIQRRPALPELMKAGKYQYHIDVRGGIRLLPEAERSVNAGASGRI
jgi:hypothetical protein